MVESCDVYLCLINVLWRCDLGIRGSLKSLCVYNYQYDARPDVVVLFIIIDVAECDRGV